MTELSTIQNPFDERSISVPVPPMLAFADFVAACPDLWNAGPEIQRELFDEARKRLRGR